MEIEKREDEFRFKFDTREEIKILTRKLIDLRGDSMSGEGPFFLSLLKDSLPVWSDQMKNKWIREHQAEVKDE